MTSANINFNNMPTTQASAQEFVQCGVAQTAAQYVTVPMIEHLLVTQPVMYKQYKQKITYSQMPVTQTYSKVNMPQKDNGCDSGQVQQAAVQYGQTGPVYGCGAAPYSASGWGDAVDPTVVVVDATVSQQQRWTRPNQVNWGRANSYASRY